MKLWLVVRWEINAKLSFLLFARQELLGERVFLWITNVGRLPACPVQPLLDVLTFFICLAFSCIYAVSWKGGQPRQLHMKLVCGSAWHHTVCEPMHKSLPLQAPHLPLGLSYLILFCHPKCLKTWVKNQKPRNCLMKKWGLWEGKPLLNLTCDF